MNNNTSPETATHTNVMIVGAGLSGIGAAVHLQKSCPGVLAQYLSGVWPGLKQAHLLECACLDQKSLLNLCRHSF